MILPIFKGITILFKSCATYFLGIAFLSPLAQNPSDAEFFMRLMDSVPSQIAMTFGIIYLAFVLLKKGSDVWSHHKINLHKVEKSKLKVGEEKENLEQKEIETDSKRKELES